MGVHLSENFGKKVFYSCLKTFFFFFGLHLNLGKKVFCFCLKTFFFFWSSPEFGKKSVLFLMKTFFWSSPEFGKKKCSIFDEDLFFGLHLNLGKNVFHLHFFFWSSLNFQT